MRSKKPKSKSIEGNIKNGVRNILRFERWYVINNFQGLGCYPGMSDLTAVKDGKVLFIEIKTETGKLSDNQLVFQKEIESRGGNYLVIRSVEQIIAYVKGK